MFLLDLPGASVAGKGSRSSSYHLKALNRDTLDFVSIPLTNVRGMELHASLGYSASANFSSRNVFFGLLDCCEVKYTTFLTEG